MGATTGFEIVPYLDFVQSRLEAIRYKGVAINLFFHPFSMSGPETTLKKCPIYVILHMMHTCGMYKVELTTEMSNYAATGAVTTVWGREGFRASRNSPPLLRYMGRKVSSTRV